MIPPKHGKPLLLHLSIIEDVVGSMLAQDDDDKNERVVYYLSKRFHDYETRYTPIEKSIMLCSRMGGTKIETHYPTLPNMSSNGSIEILV